MKKLILVVITFILLMAAVTTTIIIAQEDTLSPQSLRLENSFNQQLRRALSSGIINQELTDRLIQLWQQNSEDDKLKLYQRVVNFIQSKRQEVRLENAFFETLGKAVELGYIEREQYINIVSLWEQKTLDEQLMLYHRIINLINSRG